jgi:hypothetical protein
LTANAFPGYHPDHRDQFNSYLPLPASFAHGNQTPFEAGAAHPGPHYPPAHSNNDPKAADAVSQPPMVGPMVDDSVYAESALDSPPLSAKPSETAQESREKSLPGFDDALAATMAKEPSVNVSDFSVPVVTSGGGNIAQEDGAQVQDTDKMEVDDS